MPTTDKSNKILGPGHCQVYNSFDIREMCGSMLVSVDNATDELIGKTIQEYVLLCRRYHYPDGLSLTNCAQGI